MSDLGRYPQLHLRSKNEIAKRISSASLTPKEALALINDVLKNFDLYWYDSKSSEPEKEKYVRSAAKSPALKKLLWLINRKILAPHDKMIPDFAFGGLSSKSNIEAAHRLLGKKRGRILLKLDIKSFFEQMTEKRVFYFFHKKCGCTVEASKILAFLCCVPRGPKGSGEVVRILARGFATSPRLALWCNLNTFQHLDWRMKKRLRTHDPRVAIYVDDVGVTASRVTQEKMEGIKAEAIDILENFDENQKLPAHRDKKKTKIIAFKDGAEHLGIKFGRNKLSLGHRARSNTDKMRNALKSAKTGKEKKEILEKYQAHHRYKHQVESFNPKGA